MSKKKRAQIEKRECVQRKADSFQRVLKVECLARRSDGAPGVYHVLSYLDIDTKEHWVLMPSEKTANLGELKKFLIRHHFPAQNSKESWRLIQCLIEEGSEERAEIVTSPGFYDLVYLGPDNVEIGGGELQRLYLDPQMKLPLPDVGEKGTLLEWRENVAYVRQYSSRLTLANSMTFSCYIQHFSEVESGGVHFHGTSSKGKSILINAALSIQGPASNFRHWDATETGFEELLAAHNHSMLALDDTQIKGGGMKEVAVFVSKAIYKLTAGSAKQRTVNFSLDGRGPLSWLLSVISTGELSMQELAVAGGVERRPGEVPRMVDVPLDVDSEYGIFDTLPPGCDSPVQLAEDLKENSKKFYGTARSLFVQKLLHNIKSDKSLVNQRVARAMAHFLDSEVVEIKDGIDARLAKRFALAYAGGLFAVKYNILPLTEDQLLQGILDCYAAAMETGRASVSEYDQAKRFVEGLLSSYQFVDLKSIENASKKWIKRADGYLTVVNGCAVKAIRSSHLHDLFEGKVLTRLMKSYCEEGSLIPDAEGKHTRQVQIDKKSRIRCYCFLADGI